MLDSFTTHPKHIYSRPAGHDYLHDELPDGASRGLRPATKPRDGAAPIVAGSLVATRASDGDVVPFDPSGTDGSQTPDGISLCTFRTAWIGTRVAVFPDTVPVLARHAEVIGSRITWPDGITSDQKAAAVAQLAALGIAVI